MMMKCLEAGGLTACYNKSKDKILNEKYISQDYNPNPDGYFELGKKEFDSEKFPEIYAGKLIKVLHWRLEGLPDFNYKVIFMLRNPKEIEVSYLKMFRTRPPFVLYKYNEFIGNLLDALRLKPNMEIMTVRYEDVLETPADVFSRIKKNNWPIADEKIQSAAGCVNKSLYRSKEQDLEDIRKKMPGIRTDLPKILSK
jgi:hypothetical protein